MLGPCLEILILRQVSRPLSRLGRLGFYFFASDFQAFEHGQKN